MSAGSSNGSNGLLAIFILTGGLIPVATSLLAACGGANPATAADASAPPPSDGSVHLVTVVTTGGGAPSPGSSGSSTPADPFGSGTSSGSGASSGSSSGDAPMDSAVSGTGSSSGSGSSDSSTDSGGTLDGGADVDSSSATPNVCSDYVSIPCGTIPCDLRSNTCCFTITGVARCLPGASAKCASNEATGHCLNACDCAGGTVCCGVMNTILGVVQSQCQDIPDGGLCNPHPQTSTQASMQLCRDTSECKNGEACTKQTCVYNVTGTACGLQSQSPFNCH